MYAVNQIIDAVQNAKKTAVEQITHEGIKSSLIKLIDAQTAYSKTVAQLNQDIFTQFAESVLKFDPKSIEVPKFDFASFTNGVKTAKKTKKVEETVDGE